MALFRKLARGLCALSVLVVTGCGSTDSDVAQPPPLGAAPFAPAVETRLDEALERTRRQVHIPSVIVSLHIPGEGLWERAVGVADKTTEQPMQAGMHTRIGSITKTVTVTALLLLAQDGRLGLDDPVSKFLDFVPNGDNMTSGLFSYSQDDTFVTNLLSNPLQGYTARALVDIGLSHPPRFAPGTGLNYSNTNTVLLGMIIEQVSGKTLAAFFSERIFQPLGMNNTSWPTGTDLPAPYARGYTEQTPTGAETEATFLNPSWTDAAGQLISNLHDLKIWCKALGEGALLTPEMQSERLQLVHLTPRLGYGLGIGYYNGWLGHSGELPGYNTGIYYLPSKGAVLAVQTNSDIPLAVPGGEVNPVPALFREIAKVVTPDNVPDGLDLPGEDPGIEL
jgi:D-alanyl-D-alanine carboxypeptidase